MKDESQIFCTHVKQPCKHFYFKHNGYPINFELLKLLDKIQIKYILIPEDTSPGFHCYLGNIKEYLNGSLIREPLTEKQKVIPLEYLEEIEISKETLIRVL